MPKFESLVEARQWLVPRVALDPRLTDRDVEWLNGQMELVDKPAVRFAREIFPPSPSCWRERVTGVFVTSTDMAHGYEPPSMSLRLPTERIS